MANNLPPRTTRVNPNEPNVGDLNLDPLTDEPGSHPVGTGVGAAGGALAGAAIGAVGGPVGAAAGAVVGAIAGGLAGHAAGEAVNPTIGGATGEDVASVANPQEEDLYWRDAYVAAPYYSAGRTYDDYAPAYRLGYTSRARYEGAFDDHEPTLASEWDSFRGASRLTWDEAKAATRDAWDRITVEAPRRGSFDHS